MKVPFNTPLFVGREEYFVREALKSGKLSGDGPFGLQCQGWFEEKFGLHKTLLVPSCTAALELCALLIDIKHGDEVIMPSFTFVSTANAFVLRGAKIVFVDICPQTMNIDVDKIEAAITPKTRAIVPVHYAGVGCEMDKIMQLSEKYNLFVIEDAAQGMMGKYKGQPLGGIGHMGAFSFHQTKNYTSAGEGGLLIINDRTLVEKAEVMREKGTNRANFIRGHVDKYTWLDMGSSYLMSDLQAAYLWGQLEQAHLVNSDRLQKWHFYFEKLLPLRDMGLIELAAIPGHVDHNGHIFFMKLQSTEKRDDLLEFLNGKQIGASFHYIPLHSSPAGREFGRMSGSGEITTFESGRLLRLPLNWALTEKEQTYVVESIFTFYDKKVR